MIHLCQYLCPSRHCIMAAAYTEDQAPQDIEIGLLEEMLLLGINPWCGLCGSPELHFEHGRTPYHDLGEALPHLQAEARKQALTRQLFTGLQKGTN